MAAYARITFLASLKLAGLLTALLLLAVTLILLFEQVSAGFAHFLLDWRAIIFSVAFASLYYLARSVARGHV